MTPQERFSAKFRKNGPIPKHKPHLGRCWPWTASLTTWGYGSFCYEGKTHNASRIAYLFEYGPFDTSKNVCHHCDNPACVRPSHLFLGTQPENLDDCRRKGRDRYAHGRDHWNSKLTENIVAEIEQSLERAEKSHRQIAKEFGVSRSVINEIANGTAWKHATKNLHPAKPRGTFTKGENAPLVKLKSQDIPIIRAMIKAGTKTGIIAKQFNVTRENIYSIRDGKTWGHIK